MSHRNSDQRPHRSSALIQLSLALLVLGYKAGIQLGSGATLEIIFAVLLLHFVACFLVSEVLLCTKELEHFRVVGLLFFFLFLKAN